MWCTEKKLFLLIKKQWMFSIIILLIIYCPIIINCVQTTPSTAEVSPSIITAVYDTIINGQNNGNLNINYKKLKTMNRVSVVSNLNRLSDLNSVNIGVGSSSSEEENKSEVGNDFSKISDKEIVELLVKQWAPLVWLAPGEKYMPGDVTEFLQHVHAEKTKANNKNNLNNNNNNNYNNLDDNEYISPEQYYYYYDMENELSVFDDTRRWDRRNKRNFKDHNTLIDYITGLPVGENSENWFLVTNDQIDDLLENSSSFLFGQNPTVNAVPIYSVVNRCTQPIINKPQKAPVVNITFNDIDNIEYKHNPYIPLTGIADSHHHHHHHQQQPEYSAYIPAINMIQTRTTSKEEMLLLNDESNINKNNILRRLQRSTITITTTGGNNNNIDEKNNSEEQQHKQIQTNEHDKEKGEWKSTPEMSKEYLTNYDDVNEMKMEQQQQQQHQDNMPHFHVTYWMFYPYNQGKAMCTLNLGPLGRVPIPHIFGMCLGSKRDFGSHVGDWEHMSLFFRGRKEPDEMYVSAHDAGAYYKYDRLTGTFEFVSQETRKGILQRPNFPKTVLTSSNHPVLFAAQGSHGLWTAPGKHRFVRVPRLYDINGFGTPWSTWKSMEIVYNGDDYQGRSLNPSWLQFRGRWGNPKSRCHPLRRIGLHFCEYFDGPPGIPIKRPNFYCNIEQNFQ